MILLKQKLYAFVEKNFLQGCSNYNSLSTRKSCRSKKQARQMFARHGIPHARGTIFYGFIKPFLFAKKVGFPLVVKPNVGGFSRGSHFPINTWFDLLKAVIMVKLWWPSSVIEQYLEGKNYRIAVVKNDIMSVIRRYPPFVDGDGESTIDTLIKRENQVRDQMNLAPVIHPITKNRAVSGFLKKQGLTFKSIPRKNQRVTLYQRISLAPGGVVETLNKNHIHAVNRDLFLKIPGLFNANVLGIDAIFEKGIEKPYTDQKTIFLEINSRPYLKMHDYPRYGQKENLTPYFEQLEQLKISRKDIF